MRKIIVYLLVIAIISFNSMAQTESESPSNKFDIDEPSTWRDNPNEVSNNIDVIWKNPSNWDIAVAANPNVLDDQKRVEDYFTKNPTKMNDPTLKPKAINYFRNSFGYEVTLDGQVVKLNPRGKPPILQTSGARESKLENFVNMPKGTTITIDKDGYIIVNKIKISGEAKYNRPPGDNLGSFDIPKGTINGKEVISGKNIIYYNNIISGTANVFEGVTFQGDGSFLYDQKDNTATALSDIVKIAKDVKILTSQEITIWPDKEKNPSDKQMLYSGKVAYSCNPDCKLREIGDQDFSTLILNKGRLTGTTIGTKVSVYYDENEVPPAKIPNVKSNYILLGKNYDEYSGSGHKTTYEEGNGMFNIVPTDKVADAVGARLVRNVAVEPAGGKVQVQPVENPNREVSLHFKGEGNYKIENGVWDTESKDGKVFSRQNRPTASDGYISVATDMRIENKQGNNVKIFDMNTPSENTRLKSPAEIEKSNNALVRISNLKGYLEDRKAKNLDEDKKLEWDNVFRYLDKQTATLSQNYDVNYPVFGEVLTANKITVQGSSFFNDPIINIKEATITGTEYQGGALIVVSKGGPNDVPFDLVGRTAGSELAKKGLYVLYLENEVKDYNHFFEILQSPTFESIQPDLKPKIIEVISHMWSIQGSTGSRMGYDEAIHHEPIEKELRNLIKSSTSDAERGYYQQLLNSYYTDLSRGRMRGQSLETLSPLAIERIKENLDKDTLISYDGCYAGRPYSISYKTNDLLSVPVRASQAGTYVQKYYPQFDKWSAYELDKNGDPIKRGNELQYAKVGPNDKARMWPNEGYLSDPGVQVTFPGINSFMTITDSKVVGNTKLYEVEYEKKDGSKERVWVTQSGTRVNELITGENKIGDGALINYRPQIKYDKLTSDRRDYDALDSIDAYMQAIDTAKSRGVITDEQFSREIDWASQQDIRINGINALRKIGTRPQFLEQYGLVSYGYNLDDYSRNLGRAYQARLIPQQRYEQETRFVQQERDRISQLRTSRGAGIVVTQR